MKCRSSQSWIIIIMILVGINHAFAHDFEVAGIYYRKLSSNNKTVEVTYKGENSLIYSNEYTGNVTIPTSVNYAGTTYKVISIGESAFFSCVELKKVTIPNTITSIGKYAFSDCANLSKVQIPKSVAEIGRFAFHDCPGLSTIIIDPQNKIYDSRNNCNAIIETKSNTMIVGCKNTSLPKSVKIKQ